MRRFFLAHAKSESSDRIAELRAQAERIVRAASEGASFRVIAGRDWFEFRFAECGSWDAWAQEVATGYRIDGPIFHAIVVPGSRVGAGTARIVDVARRTGKPVFLMKDESMVHIAAIRRVDMRDWQTGWAIW